MEKTQKRSLTCDVAVVGAGIAINKAFQQHHYPEITAKPPTKEMLGK